VDDHKIETNLRQKSSGPMKFMNSQYKKIPYKVTKIPCKYNRTAGYWKMEIDLKTRPRRVLQGKKRNTRPEYQLVRSGYLSKYPPGLFRPSPPLMTRREVESQWSPQCSRQHSVPWSAWGEKDSDSWRREHGHYNSHTFSSCSDATTAARCCCGHGLPV
jgi:hypothetical protein